MKPETEDQERRRLIAEWHERQSFGLMLQIIKRQREHEPVAGGSCPVGGGGIVLASRRPRSPLPDRAA